MLVADDAWRRLTTASVGSSCSARQDATDRVGEADSRRLLSRCHVRRQGTMVKIVLTKTKSLTQHRNGRSGRALHATKVLDQYEEPRPSLVAMAAFDHDLGSRRPYE